MLLIMLLLSEIEKILHGDKFDNEVDEWIEYYKVSDSLIDFTKIGINTVTG